MDEPAGERTVEIDDVEAAAVRIEGAAVRTPIMTSMALDERVGRRVFVKPEILQVGGSFKFRGAYNRLAQLDAQQRAAGVVAWSSGNHAQGVAAAAQLLGVSASIVMPHDAPVSKIANTKRLGAEVIGYDRRKESREEIATSLAVARGATLVPSFDDLNIIAGQGTVGLEIAEQLAAREEKLDTLLVCCGGGGLIAGSAIAMVNRSPQTAIYSVEPADFDDTARSLTAGKRLFNNKNSHSICDALLAPAPGTLTFPINQALLTGGYSVTDDEVRDAMRFAFLHLKLVVEPGGAVALASLLSGRHDIPGERVGIVISGGNVDPEMFASIILPKL